MKAVHLEAGQVDVIQAAPPERPRGFARIRMVLAGICNTDLELQRGYYGFSGIPGHEFTGVVTDADDECLIGRRVVGEINLNCATCDVCKAGLGRHCPQRTVLGIVEHPGAFAEYLTLPERNLHFVPPEISDDEAVFTEPLAAACEILDQLPIGAGSKVAVLGDGKLGLLCSLVLRANGADVTLFGRHEHKLGIARKVGIEALDREDRRPAAFPVVVEATGSREGLRQAVSMARPRGAVVMKTTVHDPVEIDSAAVVVNEINLVGSRCGRFEPALHLLRTKQIDVLPLVSAEFRLSEAPEAFSMAARRGVLKVLLRNESARFQT